jgi:tRNA-Thr(GGU) m(6)t(6)A37 methyltransferase TsaA
VRSPYKERKDAPRQGRLSDTVSEIVIDDQYLPGLDDIETNPNLIVLSWFDRSDRTVLRATPPHKPVEHGVFATRSPDRPNPVAFSVVDLLGRDGNILRVRGLDALDGTPVVDIKPYSPDIDCVKNLKGNEGQKKD